MISLKCSTQNNDEAVFIIKKTSREVFFDVELGVNYVTHLYTLAKAGFDDVEYVKQYETMIPRVSLDYLRSHAKLLSFHGRDHGPFAERLYFTPAYFNLDTQEKLAEYFTAWSQAVHLKSHLPFKKYSLYPEYLPGFFTVDNQTWEEQILPLDKIFMKIAQIYIDNMNAYKKEVWPKISPILIKRSELLNPRIKPGLIEKWEECTGVEFEKEQYKVVLYFAGKHGPSWNNLSIDKNSAFYNHNQEEMVAMISHEIGIHLLLPYLQKKIQYFENTLPRINKPGIYGLISYMGFESLVAFYNERILGTEFSTGRDANDYPLFQAIFNDLAREDMSPLDMYTQGIERYVSTMKQKGHSVD